MCVCVCYVRTLARQHARARARTHTHTPTTQSLSLSLTLSHSFTHSLTGQVAIVTSVTTSVAAWLEFHSTAQKVSRYNGIIVSLSNILLWWDSMGDVDKASPTNIDLLVQMGEATLNAERGAWLSAGASKEDQEKGKKGKGEDETEK